MQAIVTKWMPPTDTRGSRIKVWCDAKALVVPWDHEYGAQVNHQNAIAKLLRAQGWGGQWVTGAAPKRSPHFLVAVHVSGLMSEPLTLDGISHAAD